MELTDRVADVTIEDTGERMVPAHHRGHLLYGEHLARYEAAVPLCSGKTVLDIASGSGYGTKMLAGSAAKVYGVDLDAGAVAYAARNYAAANLEFLTGAAESIPLPDACCDVAVSFETIEHVAGYGKFLSEIKRVLKPGGLLVLSTPNDEAFPESNTFHVHEFERAELQAEIGRQFSHTTEYFQGTWLYSGLFDAAKLGAGWNGPVQTSGEAPIAPSEAVYFLVLCADRPITETVEARGVLSEVWSARKTQEYEASMRAHMADQQGVMDHLGRAVEELERALAGERGRSEGLSSEVGGLRARYSLAERLRAKIFRSK